MHTITDETQVSFRQFTWGDFHAHLLASLTLISMKKKLQEKKYTFLSSQNPGINCPYFQLPWRWFRFPSQLISQCNFSQLAQILHEERVFCRAAPLGTPENNRRLHIAQKITKNLTTLHNLPNTIHKLQIKPCRENKKSDIFRLWIYLSLWLLKTRPKRNPVKIGISIISAKSPNSQFLNSDISSLLCLILLQHPWLEILFHRLSFAIACSGSTFSQRLLLGTKRSLILPLNVSLDISPQIWATNNQRIRALTKARM